jgi:hypothetical protein
MTLPEQATALAEDQFGRNLLFSFVGGSWGAGRQKATSDIDLFVCLRTEADEAERCFADDFAALHDRAALKLTHCGEIFDLATLNSLLDFTNCMLNCAPFVLQSACYHGDCILSIFRKGHIVMGFFGDPKICAIGDRCLLSEYERMARAYLSAPSPRTQRNVGCITQPSLVDEEQAVQQLRVYYESRVREGNYADTPVGICLSRWFGDCIPHRAPAPRGQQIRIDIPSDRCPRCFAVPDSQLDILIRSQCLGTHARRLKTPRRNAALDSAPSIAATDRQF